ncbi:unnamed protein product [Effrenium voratum]|uniref:C3H1-type domain-containing protein n=1 Tax=Effrenium voratum TaxID=2562239 RepID=A0AA36J050_9DINO|nr:unnamed protein product [Effrenium voratum]
MRRLNLRPRVTVRRDDRRTFGESFGMMACRSIEDVLAELGSDSADNRKGKTGGARAKLLEAFVSPVPLEFLPVNDTYGSTRGQRTAYYKTMQANLLAEAAAAFKSGGQRLLLNGRRQGTPGVNARLLVSLPPERRANAEPKSQLSELQLKDNVLEVDGELFWVTVCEVDERTAAAGLEGFSLDGRRLENFEECGVKVRLFAGDYSSRLNCALELEELAAPVPELERMVLDPSRPVASTLRGCGWRIHDEMLPINEDQQLAVRSLTHRVELIHGPPGTGKSTTIFHILNNRLPAAAAAVVTCVTNQAIDAVAEKLSTAHEGGGLKILVLGNPDRVGKTAGKYTLEQLCLRDDLVVSMRWAAQVLHRTLSSLQLLQKTRNERLWRPHNTSRLRLADIEKLPSVQRYAEELQRENRKRRLSGMPEEAYDPMRFYLDRLNASKEKMAWVVVRSRPLRYHKFCRGLVFGQPFRAFNVEQLLQKVSAAHRKAQSALAVAQATAQSRTVRNTRVFLCTIPSGYKVQKLQEDFEKDFPGRLVISILDEAAATAETYMPLILRMGVENLVLLGDHKQLNPLVLATAGDWEIKDKQVDRSFMERAMQSGCKLHALHTQYRMPDILCKLVSQLFYGGRLSTDFSVQMAGMGLGENKVLQWLTVNSRELEVGTSRVNFGEVAAVVSLLQTSRALKNPRENVMIITLYKPQAALLSETLQKFLPERLDSGNVKVVTVDAAQGSEAPHIVLSTVRSNNEYNIGFASNPRRLCVAISRAQKTLTVVGNADVFWQSRPNWCRVVDYFWRNGTSHPAQMPASILEVAKTRAEEMAERSYRAPKGKGKGKGKGAERRERCVHYARGRCRHGMLCAYLHD